MNKLRQISKKVLMFVLCSIVFTGCLGGQKPKEAVKESIDSFCKQDWDSLSKVSSVKFKENIDKSEDEQQKLLIPKMTDIKYKILEEKVDESDKNKATVKVEMEINDIADVMMKLIPEAMGAALTMSFSGADNKQMDKYMDEKLKDKLNGDIPRVKKTVDVNLQKDGEKWVICEDNKEFFNGLLGNMLSLENVFKN